MQTNTQTEIIRFDRHEIYTDEMMDLNMKLVRDRDLKEYTNILYGLFDGYLYPRLLESTNPKIQKLINLINQKIK
tara:strand:- start:644 stop:868 length:225 start_codon:yes stop_codon:yes gene_type:complete